MSETGLNRRVMTAACGIGDRSRAVSQMTQHYSEFNQDSDENNPNDVNYSHPLFIRNTFSRVIKTSGGGGGNEGACSQSFVKDKSEAAMQCNFDEFVQKQQHYQPPSQFQAQKRSSFQRLSTQQELMQQNNNSRNIQSSFEIRKPLTTNFYQNSSMRQDQSSGAFPNPKPLSAASHYYTQAKQLTQLRNQSRLTQNRSHLLEKKDTTYLQNNVSTTTSNTDFSKIKLTNSLYKVRQERHLEGLGVQSNVRPHSRSSGNGFIKINSRNTQFSQNLVQNRTDQLFKLPSGMDRTQNSFNQSRSLHRATQNQLFIGAGNPPQELQKYSSHAGEEQVYLHLQTSLDNNQAIIPMILNSEDVLMRTQTSDDGTASQVVTPDRKLTILSRQGARKHTHLDDLHSQEAYAPLKDVIPDTTGQTPAGGDPLSYQNQRMKPKGIERQGLNQDLSSYRSNREQQRTGSQKSPAQGKKLSPQKQNTDYQQNISTAELKRWSSRKPGEQRLQTISDIFIADQDGSGSITIADRQRVVSNRPKKKGKSQIKVIQRRGRSQQNLKSNVSHLHAKQITNYTFDGIPDYEEGKAQKILDIYKRKLSKQSREEGRVQPVSVSFDDETFIFDSGVNLPLFIGHMKKNPGIDMKEIINQQLNKRSCIYRDVVKASKELNSDIKIQYSQIANQVLYSNMKQVIPAGGGGGEREYIDSHEIHDDYYGAAQKNGIIEAYSIPHEWTGDITSPAINHYSIPFADEPNPYQQRDGSTKNFIYKFESKQPSNHSSLRGSLRSLRQSKETSLSPGENKKHNKNSKIIYSIHHNSQYRNSTMQRSRQGGLGYSPTQDFVRKSLEAKPNQRKMSSGQKNSSMPSLEGVMNVRSIKQDKSTISSNPQIIRPMLVHNSNNEDSLVPMNKSDIAESQRVIAQASSKTTLHSGGVMQKIELQLNVLKDNRKAGVPAVGVQRDSQETRDLRKSTLRQKSDESHVVGSIHLRKSINEDLINVQGDDDIKITQMKVNFDSKKLLMPLVATHLLNESSQSSLEATQLVEETRYRKLSPLKSLRKNMPKTQRQISSIFEVEAIQPEVALMRFSTLKAMKSQKLSRNLKNRARSAVSRKTKSTLEEMTIIQLNDTGSSQEGANIPKVFVLASPGRDIGGVDDGQIKISIVDNNFMSVDKAFDQAASSYKDCGLVQASQIDLMKNSLQAAESTELQVDLKRRSSRNVMSKLQGKSLTMSSMHSLNSKSPLTNSKQIIHNLQSSESLQEQSLLENDSPPAPSRSCIPVKEGKSTFFFPKSTSKEGGSLSNPLMVIFDQNHDQKVSEVVEEGKKSTISVNEDDEGFFKQSRRSSPMEKQTSGNHQKRDSIQQDEWGDSYHLQAAIMEKVIVKSPGKRITTEHVIEPQQPIHEKQASQKTAAASTRIPHANSAQSVRNYQAAQGNLRKGSQNSDLTSIDMVPAESNDKKRKTVMRKPKDEANNSSNIRSSKCQSRGRQTSIHFNGCVPLQASEYTVVENMSKECLNVADRGAKEVQFFVQKNHLARHGRAPPSVIMRNKIKIQERTQSGKQTYTSRNNGILISSSVRNNDIKTNTENQLLATFHVITLPPSQPANSLTHTHYRTNPSPQKPQPTLYPYTSVFQQLVISQSELAIDTQQQKQQLALIKAYQNQQLAQTNPAALVTSSFNQDLQQCMDIRMPAAGTNGLSNSLDRQQLFTQVLGTKSAQSVAKCYGRGSGSKPRSRQQEMSNEGKMKIQDEGCKEFTVVGQNIKNTQQIESNNINNA